MSASDPSLSTDDITFQDFDFKQETPTKTEIKFFGVSLSRINYVKGKYIEIARAANCHGSSHIVFPMNMVLCEIIVDEDPYAADDQKLILKLQQQSGQQSGHGQEITLIGEEHKAPQIEGQPDKKAIKRIHIKITTDGIPPPTGYPSTQIWAPADAQKARITSFKIWKKKGP
jgi:hypothetical protein